MKKNRSMAGIGCGAHASTSARNTGMWWERLVVDMRLEWFFDRVNHDILLRSLKPWDFLLTAFTFPGLRSFDHIIATGADLPISVCFHAKA